MPITRIRRNAAHLNDIFDSARHIKVYSLSNGFVGKDLDPNPIDSRYWPKEVRYCSQSQFLKNEHQFYSFSKLYRRNNGIYTLHIHSNLWYEFTI